MKKLLSILLICVMLLTSGCTFTLKDPAQTTGSTEPPVSTDASVAPTDVTEPVTSDALTVEKVRQQLVKENKSFAVAYLGYLTYDFDTVWDFIDSLGEDVLKQMPYLSQIPETNMICNAVQGEVYCLILANPDEVIKISAGSDDTNFDNVVYEGSGEDPYLLVCNTGVSPDTQIEIIGEEGVLAIWNPKLDEYLFVDQLRYVGGDTESLDVTPYNGILLNYYKGMLELGGWEVPEKADLEGKAWYWDGYTPAGNYYSYKIAFHADTLDAWWNHGYGEEQSYTGAKWEIADGNIPVLSIDFGEFAGMRKYNVLLNRSENTVYIASDATGKALTWDSEALYRFLIPAETEKAPETVHGTDPVDLVGSWQQIQTEVEGDVNKTPAGQVTAEITGTDKSDLRMTYHDREVPDQDFEDRSLFIMPGDNYDLPQEENWIAEVNYSGNENFTVYLTITLIDANTFDLERMWYVDGAPMVAHATFQRIG